MQYLRTIISLIILSIWLSACSSGGGSSPLTYVVGGTATGLSGDGLVLQNNGGDDLAVAGVAFEFTTALTNGVSYVVTVLVQPNGQSCDVSNGSGTISGANVTDVTLTCRGWGTAELIETDNASSAILPQIATDAAGNALAVWFQYDGARYNIWANRYTAGSGWGTAELIETDNAGGAYDPQIATDAAGNALAVWQQDDGARLNIWANRYTAGSGWGTAELIETDNADSAALPQIATDIAGNALAVWYQHDGSRYNIWANRYTAGSGWGTAELIETDNAGGASDPQIATDIAGNALAVWSQYDGFRSNIWANRFE